jgi:O-antigen/teichoic acid export membrane protein
MAAILGMYVVFGDTTLDVVITVGIFTVGTFFSNLSDGLTAIFYAHEKAEYPAGVTAITTLTRVSVGALVLLLGWGIIGLAGASLVANLVAFIILSRLLINKIFRPHLEVDQALQKEMMGQSFPLMINHLLSTIFFRIDIFILKPTRGNTEVGFYSAAYKYVDGINVIPQYFTLAIFPLMSRFAANSRESLVRAYILSLRLLLILAMPIAMGTPFVARELILFLAGERFIPDSVIVLQLLIWFLPFSFINQVTQYVLIAINQQRQLTRAFVIGVLFNTITNLIFIPLYGYRAAAITTILSEWSLLIPFYLLADSILPVGSTKSMYSSLVRCGLAANRRRSADGGNPLAHRRHQLLGHVCCRCGGIFDCPGFGRRLNSTRYGDHMAGSAAGAAKKKIRFISHDQTFRVYILKP